ncbi:hypothetical protein BLNAU_22304 [Blattamonas nauphoetae]|uniref:Uncharacterized protein n=1 Tax=Blattamonas nauphoetae TaxID=2049346 RepID=A0ABQ9WTF5_9EUKA|nr:hypothetical protein BLNAU_22304 [Blattamonas nauphoetae]
MDCSAFLNWTDAQQQAVREKAVVFRSLIATVKLQPSPDETLEAKVVKLLESVNLDQKESADAFLNSPGRTIDESLTDFVQSVVVLLSSTNQVIVAAAMKMIRNLILFCSAKVRLALVKAGLIPQVINTLNPQSLSLTEAVDTHINVMRIINHSLLLATPDGLTQLGIEDSNEQQAVHKMVLTQVLAPSEKYICHLCANHTSIVDGDQSKYFLFLLVQLIQISPFYKQTLEFDLILPVFLTIPSCLTFFEADGSIWLFLYDMNQAQRLWNIYRGEMREMWKPVDRMFRMEGIEDVIEQKKLNDKDGSKGRWIVDSSLAC